MISDFKEDLQMREDQLKKQRLVIKEKDENIAELKRELTKFQFDKKQFEAGKERVKTLEKKLDYILYRNAEL